MSSLREIATPLRHEVLKRLDRLGERHTPVLNDANRRLYGLVGYRDFIADPDQVGGDTTEPEITPIRNRHRQ